MSGPLLDVRSNIGISLFPGHGSDVEALMRRASIALVDRPAQIAHQRQALRTPNTGARERRHLNPVERNSSVTAAATAAVAAATATATSTSPVAAAAATPTAIAASAATAVLARAGLVDR